MNEPSVGRKMSELSDFKVRDEKTVSNYNELLRKFIKFSALDRFLTTKHEIGKFAAKLWNSLSSKFYTQFNEIMK